MLLSRKIAISLLVVGLAGVTCAQDGNLTPPEAGQSVKGVLADIQSRVNGIQTLKASLEFDRKDEDAKKKKKKLGDKPYVPNPEWPEPIDRDIERGPLEISRSNGAYARLERKKDKEEFIANSSILWKYDVKEKEARRVSSSLPVVSTFVSNALVMNVFVAMDEDTIKLRGTESVDGVPCWVLEGQSPARLKMVGVEPTKLKIWVGKEDGIPRVIRVPKHDDTIIRLKDIRLNEPVDASRFAFTPPSNVKVKNILGF